MKKSIAEALQRRLKALGLYAGEIDGDRGPKTIAAVNAALADRASAMAGWTDLRRAVAVLQLWAEAEGVETGAIDGRWGPQTEFAVDTVMAKEATGAMPPAWRDEIEPGPAADTWPRQSGLTGWYGPPGRQGGAAPPYIVNVPTRWKLKIAWDFALSRKHFSVHQKVANSLGRVLDKVLATYGEANIARLGLDLFGGDYNARPMRGGTQPSTHSWGIAIDFDPEKNPLKASRETARFAHPDYEDWWRAWEAEGWLSLGRARNFDWMHVQAARL